jgi:acyl-CoA hydrolase
MSRTSEITLRFLAAPTDVETLGGTVGGGKALEWIDKAAYALSVMWCGGNAVTAYVGDVHFRRPIESGHLVEVTASLVHTGRSSMHIRVVATSTDPRGGEPVEATDCLVIFVAVDESGASVPVPAWTPQTDEQRALREAAVARIDVRSRIEAAMSRQTYTGASEAHRITLRFQAKPTDVNWAGKTHGGNVMRWIDEAAHLCCVGWTGSEAIAVYSGGIRFYRPIQIGDIVEVEARLVYTGRSSMHVSVHVRSGDPRNPQMQLTTHCLTILVALDEEGRLRDAPPWLPRSEEDRRLADHARELMALRTPRGESSFSDRPDRTD